MILVQYCNTLPLIRWRKGDFSQWFSNGMTVSTSVWARSRDGRNEIYSLFFLLCTYTHTSPFMNGEDGASKPFRVSLFSPWFPLAGEPINKESPAAAAATTERVVSSPPLNRGSGGKGCWEEWLDAKKSLCGCGGREGGRGWLFMPPERRGSERGKASDSPLAGKITSRKTAGGGIAGEAGRGKKRRRIKGPIILCGQIKIKPAIFLLHRMKMFSQLGGMPKALLLALRTHGHCSHA